MNELYYGDNLAVLREHVADASVDLIYLDPPFNSNASYNVLFKGASGDDSAAQIEAFDDTWQWSDMVSGRAMAEVQDSGYEAAGDMLTAMVGFLGKNAMTAYLAMMAVRLVELHRVLKPTGSLYLHCDPTASHYLKILLDAVFGANRFLNEISWKRTEAHNDANRYGRITDTILFYSKTDRKTFHPKGGDYSSEQLSRYKHNDDAGQFKAENLTAPHFSPTRTIDWRGTHPGESRQWRFGLEQLEQLYQDGRILLRRDGAPRKDGLKEYLHENESPVMQDIWTDIRRIGNTSSERLGYPTQKPQALLERIISASSNPGDTVLDPFCGCGTTVHAAQALGRRWIGIDVTPIAISLIRTRLTDAFQGKAEFAIRGLPVDLDGARMMFAEDDSTKKRFEMWAVGQIDAYPQGGGRKGADGGVDGFFRFGPGRAHKALVSVKGGKVSVPAVRELDAVVTRDKAAIGVLLTLEPPTRPMLDHAAQAGTFAVEGFAPVPRIQIVTIRDTFERGAAAVAAPLRHSDDFKPAPRQKDDGGQARLL